MHRDLAFYLNPAGPERRAIMGLLRAHGVRHVGLDGFAWLPDSDAREFTGLRQDLTEAGLAVTSMHALPPLVANGQGTPPDLLAAILLDLSRLAAAGGKTAVYHACWMRDVPPEHIDGEIGRVGWPAFRATYAATVGLLARRAAPLGLSVVLENVWHSSYGASVAPILEILDLVEEPNVGLCLDAGHAHLAGRRVADEIRTAGLALRDTHFHDNRGRIGDRFLDQHLPPGLGTIDWQDACRALNQVAFQGPVVFEGVLGPGDSILGGRFGGRQSHADLIGITVRNWRAFEDLAEP